MSVSSTSDSESESDRIFTSIWFRGENQKPDPIISPELRPFLNVEVIPLYHLKDWAVL